MEAPADAAGALPLALGLAVGKGASGSAVAVLAGFVAAAGFCGLSATGFAGGSATGLVDVGLVSGQLVMPLRNPFPGGGRHSSGNRMAIVNIRERLQLHFDAEATMRSEVKDGTYKVTIKVPYITAPA